jgi:hypothetical protein
MSSIRKAIIGLVTLILLGSFMLAGCASNSPSTAGPVSSPTPSPTLTKVVTPGEVLDNSLAALKKVDAYKLQADAALDLEVTGGTHPGKVSLKVNGSGALKPTAKEMQANANLSVSLPGQPEQKMAVEVYVVNGWAYAGYTLPTAAEQWAKTQITDQVWGQMGQDNISALLETAINATLDNSETINGVDYYVLTLTPNMNVITAFLKSQMAQANVDLSGFDFSQIFQNISLKEWINKQNFLPLKGTLTFGVSLNAADFKNLGNVGSSFDKMSLSLNASVAFSDYGVPFNIVVPQPGLNATPFSIPTPSATAK